MDGAIPVGVNFSPANSTVALQNLNFVSLMTIPAVAQRYMDSQIVIPISMRKYVQSTLYAAHQGVTSMRSQANESIYWPGLNRDIRLTRYNCKSCNEVAPQQHQEPLIITISKNLCRPFQKE